MTKSGGKIAKSEQVGKRFEYLDSIIENFRKEMESTLRPWKPGFAFPSLFDGKTRIPLCDMADKGDMLELQVEVPGIEKDRLDIKATGHSVEVSAEKSEKKEEKRKDYIYSERSHTSFYRKIPIPEEIIPSKVAARINNGILIINLPKKRPLGPAATKVEVK